MVTTIDRKSFIYYLKEVVGDFQNKTNRIEKGCLPNLKIISIGTINSWYYHIHRREGYKWVNYSVWNAQRNIVYVLFTLQGDIMRLEKIVVESHVSIEDYLIKLLEYILMDAVNERVKTITCKEKESLEYNLTVLKVFHLFGFEFSSLRGGLTKLTLHINK